ncbi:hypothetical protein BV898_08248 [Hypsibius exemplaris]|uniref:MARVEL domain-containing protein n=1 Tax=Hypsibius exemplaris TaxID=2072580 RepID=A0A1W0WR46_HYPEX|nr:hypothetical protein BV898_08248 [Hypsibius exemplaris]
MERDRETTTTTTVYDTRTGAVPVTVHPGVRYTETSSDVKARGCLSTCAGLQIVLGLIIIALEAACVGLYMYIEESAVGIWVGIFALIVGIFGLIAGGMGKSTGARRCIFLTELFLTLLLAAKAFAFFVASAAILATAAQYYSQYYGNTGYGGYGGVGNFGSFGSFFPGNYPGFYGSGSSYGGYGGYGGNNVFTSPQQQLQTLIGLKAALMILYLLLFLTAVIASALSCVNCCRGRSHKKKQMVMTVYPNGQSTVVQQHKA